MAEDRAGGRRKFRIVVAGDRRSGKSNMIFNLRPLYGIRVMDFLMKLRVMMDIPHRLRQTEPPDDFFPENIPITIIDTFSRQNDIGELAKELKQADAIVLTYACDEPDHFTTFWLPELRKLEVKVPVILAGCKVDLKYYTRQARLKTMMQDFQEIENCFECYKFHLSEVAKIFYCALKGVLHPRDPLFDQNTKTLKPLCVCALKRIFALCDCNCDGALSDTELNDYQVQCFGTPLHTSEVAGVKRFMQKKCPEGVNEHGITLTGFLFLHEQFLDNRQAEFTWIVLRKFGYSNDLYLANELKPSPLTRDPDQSVELTNEAIEFLMEVFVMIGSNRDGTIRHSLFEELFSTAPKCPFVEAPYKDAAEINQEELSLDGFLSKWALMTLLDPACSMENLMYIGYTCGISSAIHITRKRSFDRKSQQTERNVFQCFVFGPKYSGKSALLDSFLDRLCTSRYNPTTDERYAVRVVDQPRGTKKILVLREITEDGVGKILSRKDSMAACDVAVFLHDSTDESSWKKATELLVEVSGHVKGTGFEVPCLIVSAKNDLKSFPSARKDYRKISQEMGLEAPLRISTNRNHEVNNILIPKIVTAAEHPHLSIPDTEAGRTRKQFHPFINRSFMLMSAVGTAVALAAYRVYAARKSTSSKRNQLT